MPVFQLNANQAPNEELPQNDNQRPILNFRLVRQLLFNQAFIGYTIWTGGTGFEILTTCSNFNVGSGITGLLGGGLLIGVSLLVEKSENPLVVGLNLSTNMVVLRIFGDVPQPAVAGFISALLGTVTGVVEEVTFRGKALPRLAEWAATTQGLPREEALLAGVALSTVLFAVLHLNPTSIFKGGEAILDSLVLLVFQLVTGTTFAVLYLSTGNLAVPIVAHAAYDFYTFFKTHLEVTTQMKYAQEQALIPGCSNSRVAEKWIDERGEDFVMGVRKSFYLMDTNRDGVISRKELRVALNSYGMNLSKMESEAITRDADLDMSGEIDLEEFLEYIGPSGSPEKAAKNSLLGPI